jgi:hypothetical protein
VTKKICQIIVLGLLAAALIVLPTLSRAEGPATNAPASPDPTHAKPGKHGTLPFYGNVSAVDAKAMTLTVGVLTVQITPDTVITKNGKSATLADGVVGERVSGTYKKTEDGRLNAISVHFGPKVETKNKEVSGAGGSQ